MKKIAILVSAGVLALSFISPVGYAQGAKAKPKAAVTASAAVKPKNEVIVALQAFCSLHATLKDLEILGLSFVPGAASIPAIVSAICAVLNSQIASTSRALTAPPSDLPVSIKVVVPVTDPATGKTETATVRVKGVFNPIK